MRKSTILMSLLLGASVITLGATVPASAQQGSVPPVVNQGTQQSTDAAKKAMDAERRKQEEDAKKKAAEQMKK